MLEVGPKPGGFALQVRPKPGELGVEVGAEQRELGIEQGGLDVEVVLGCNIGPTDRWEQLHQGRALLLSQQLVGSFLQIVAVLVGDRHGLAPMVA